MLLTSIQCRNAIWILFNRSDDEMMMIKGEDFIHFAKVAIQTVKSH